MPKRVAKVERAVEVLTAREYALEGRGEEP